MFNALENNHSACLGCPQIMASRAVVNALAPQVIVVNATGCLEITTTAWPNSAWKIPWLHSLFANTPAVASGVYAALKHQRTAKKIKVLVQAGDGATFDIGLGALSGLWQRGEPIIYVCYDNEMYANTGGQTSGATPADVDRVNPRQHKKDLLAIALAHRLPYIAQTTVAFLPDLRAKVQQAAAVDGPSYLQVLAPCLPGWHITPPQIMRLAQLAADSGFYPLLEFTNGRETGKRRLPRPLTALQTYLAMQKRFANLSQPNRAYLQQLARENINKYNL